LKRLVTVGTICNLDNLPFAGSTVAKYIRASSGLNDSYPLMPS
jgi:hypothetical protein